MFHFKTDGKIPIEGASDFVINLLKRPIHTKYDEEAEARFKVSLIQIMQSLSADRKNLNEDEFCNLMQSYEPQSPNEFTDE